MVLMSRRNRLERERDRSRSPAQDSHSRTVSSPPRQTTIKVHSNRIVIRGLPNEYGWAKVKDLFREKVGFTGYLDIVDYGVGVMEFRTLDGASKAIEVMDGYKLEKGNKLRVYEETSRDREEFQHLRRQRPDRDDMGGMMSYNGSGGGRFSGGFSQNDQFMNERNVMREGMGGSYQGSREFDERQLLSPQILSYLGIEGPLTNQVFVWNLDYAVTWQKLKDVFRLAGNVLNVDVKESKDGTPRGNAVVTYEQPIEAVQAISMLNNQQLMSRPMRIRMDRDARPGNSSAQQFLTRRNSRRGEIGLPRNGRLPRELQDIGMTLKELASKMVMSNVSSSMNMMSANSPFGVMGAMGSVGSNGSSSFNNVNVMTGSESPNVGAFRGVPQIGHLGHMDMMGGLRGGNDSGYMRQMAAMAMAAGFRGGGVGGPGVGNFGETRRIMLKNLPLSYGWKELKRLVRDSGEVRYADVLYDSNQHSTGIGTVRFATSGDAVRALRKLDGINVDGRMIRAELDYKD